MSEKFEAELRTQLKDIANFCAASDVHLKNHAEDIKVLQKENEECSKERNFSKGAIWVFGILSGSGVIMGAASLIWHYLKTK